MKKKTRKLTNIFYAFCERNHNLTFYPYQRKICDKIIQTVFENKGAEIFVEISRQAGKTEALVSVIEFLLIFFPEIKGRPIRIGIFAPQKEQAKTDFDRLKDKLNVTFKKGFSFQIDPNESNSVTLQLNNGSYCFIFPLTATSHPESKTLDVIFYEEANSINDNEKKNKSDPMGSSTNANIVSVGVGGYSKNYFKTGIDRGENVVSANYKQVIKDRRKRFEQDNNPEHLSYELYVNRRIAESGEEDDAFRTQYGLEWILGVGQFITREELNALRGKFGRLGAYEEPVVIGIDTAKSPDRTIVTVKNRFPLKNKDGKEIRPRSILNWLRLQGDNYAKQFEAIKSFLKNYKDIHAIAIDSTGQGDFMPDLFEQDTAYPIIRVKFSLQSKDAMYKNLITQVRNKGTTIPNEDCQELREFEQELLDLQKEYKGEYLSCHHPDDPKAHDDYADSWALAEWADKELLEKEPDIAIIWSNKKKERVKPWYKDHDDDFEDDD